ncbi:hypothetical protein DFQ27_006318 [Actinomortierella ambigua]|uniref:Uncharacterized protein n=1 Tax=Actinomortierella ambigua TaxID=1343610 RepID=A0A9P6PYE7_9FUNG|nr:hypothetical protein DFQ27_006318 [Actinomortierella ambigua]
MYPNPLNIGHTHKKHPTSGNTQDQHTCPRYDQSFAAKPPIGELDQHLDDHEKIQEEHSSTSESDARDKALQSLRSSLIAHTDNVTFSVKTKHGSSKVTVTQTGGEYSCPFCSVAFKTK